jgi:hypothetical protein
MVEARETPRRVRGHAELGLGLQPAFGPDLS